MISNHSCFIDCYGENMHVFKSYVQADELAVDKVTKNRKYRKKIETNNS